MTKRLPVTIAAAAALAGGCSVTLPVSAPPARAGGLAVRVERIEVRAPLETVSREADRVEDTASVALVRASVRNDRAAAVPERLAAKQVALIWPGGGCQPDLLVVDGAKPAADLTLGPGETRAVRFDCHHFPYIRERTLEGDEADEERRFVETSGRPRVALALAAAPGGAPHEVELLPDAEARWVRDPLSGFNPRWAVGIDVGLAAAPALGRGGYRSQVEAGLVTRARAGELALTVTAMRNTPVTFTNQGARTVAFTPTLGWRLPVRGGDGDVRLRVGWSWAPRHEIDGRAHGPAVRLGFALNPFSKRVTREGGGASPLSIAFGEGLGLWVGWTHLRPIGMADAPPSHRLVAGLAIESLWGPGR